MYKVCKYYDRNNYQNIHLTGIFRGPTQSNVSMLHGNYASTWQGKPCVKQTNKEIYVSGLFGLAIHWFIIDNIIFDFIIYCPYIFFTSNIFWFSYFKIIISSSISEILVCSGNSISSILFYNIIFDFTMSDSPVLHN